VIVADDTPEALKAQVSGDVVTVEVEGDLAAAEATARQSVETRNVQVEGERIHLTVPRGDVAIAPLLLALDQAGVRLRSVSVSRPSLDDVFLTLTGRSLRDDEAA
jgi:ABC-2 type transport system ATP-binding protein